jgi:hypothetical protein
LDHHVQEQGEKPAKPLPVEDFVRYGQWFQRRSLPDLDPRHLARLERVEGGFRLVLDDGDSLTAHNVVIAAGIASFPNYPAVFSALPRQLVSHTSDRINRDLSRFTGRRVVVVGGGPSALESAALMHEAGAEVEVVVRQPRLRFLKNCPVLDHLMDSWLNPFQASGKIGPIGINWLIEHPYLFTSFPRPLQDWMATRSIRPAGSSWLRPRTLGSRSAPGDTPSPPPRTATGSACSSTTARPARPTTCCWGPATRCRSRATAS